MNYIFLKAKAEKKNCLHVTVNDGSKRCAMGLLRNILFGACQRISSVELNIV